MRKLTKEIDGMSFAEEGHEKCKCNFVFAASRRSIIWVMPCENA